MAGSGAKWKPSPGARWLVERAGVELFDAAGGKRESLSHPRDAIWDLLVRGYPRKTVASMLEPIADLSAEESEALVASALDSWLREGWIEEVGPD